MKDLPYDLWEPVIGLEIHAQLNTKTKMFSSAPNHFGDEPNTNISVVCTGQPGSLPVLNQEAVRKTVQFGLAVKGKIALVSRFDRKSYFYPDSPRNYQITQYDHPLVREGQIEAEVDGKLKTFTIHRTHMEDDAGMLKHFSSFAGVDYNRAGAPLIEIVSDPCMHSAKEASAYAQAIRAILLYIDACDGNMEEGSLRIDVNVSVRLKGESGLRPRIEIKNMNSFSFLEMAIESEVRRQIALYLQNPHRTPEELIPPGTYRWDPETRQTQLMRKKESADDYRYFPEPDLPPLRLTQEWIDEVALTLPELPHERRRRYVNDLGLTSYAATVVIHDRDLCNYFEEALRVHPSPRALCNWITVEFAGRLKEMGKTLPTSKIPPAAVARLVALIDSERITGRMAKEIADAMVEDPSLDPDQFVQDNPDFQPIGNVEEIAALIDEVLADPASAQSAADFLAGKEKALAYLVGQVMKRSKGKASPTLVTDLLIKKIRLIQGS